MIEYKLISKKRLVSATASVAIFIASAVVPAYAVEFEGENAQDPFRFDIGAEENAQDEEFDRTDNSGIRLQGLVWNTARPQAVINGEVVGVGDEVEGAVVEAITREGVVIRKGKEALALSFKKVAQNAPEQVFE